MFLSRYLFCSFHLKEPNNIQLRNSNDGYLIAKIQNPKFLPQFFSLLKGEKRRWLT